MATRIEDLRVGDQLRLFVTVHNTDYADLGKVVVITNTGIDFQLTADDSFTVQHHAIVVGDYIKWSNRGKATGAWGRVLAEHCHNYWVARYDDDNDSITVAKHASERDDETARVRNLQKTEKAMKESKAKLEQKLADAEYAEALAAQSEIIEAYEVKLD